MPPLTAAAAEKAEWSGRRGDHWVRSWTRTDGDREYDAATLVIQIRAGDDQSSQLLASTANGAGYDAAKHALIEPTGTDFDGDPLVFAWEVVDSSGVPSGEQVFEAQCEIDGVVTTFQRHRWDTLPQVAVGAP